MYISILSLIHTIFTQLIAYVHSWKTLAITAVGDGAHSGNPNSVKPPTPSNSMPKVS